MTERCIELQLADEQATVAVAEQLASRWRQIARQQQSVTLISLQGGLGAGKTALVRAMLRALGVAGTVRSPTYTLMEPYQSDVGACVHMDLYRLADPAELDYLGLQDFDQPSCLLLVEWPEMGAGGLPTAALELELLHQGEGRKLLIKDAIGFCDELFNSAE